MTYQTQNYGNRLIQEGYTSQVLKTVSAFGANVYKLTKYTKQANMSGCDKASRVGIGSILSLISACILPCCCSGFSEEMFEAPITGHYERTVYVKDDALTQQWVKEDFDKLGFDKDDKKSIEQYINKNGTLIANSYGHQYIPVRGHKTKCAYIIFMPYGNRKDASVCAIYDRKTGEQQNSADHIIGAHAFCGSYAGQDSEHRVIKTDELMAYGTLGILQEVNAT